MMTEESQDLIPLTKGGKCEPWRLFPSFRLLISFMAFLGLFLSAMSQSSLGATMICIADDVDNDNTTEVSALADKKTQGWILSARFLTYYICQLPSGYLLMLIGDSALALIGLLSMGIADILTVPGAQYSLPLLVFARLVQGAGNALVTTALYDVLCKWIPRHESSFLVGFAGTGFFAGASLAFVFSSIACDNSSIGWPFVFYFTGTIILLFSVVWCVFTTSDPASSRWLGQKEKRYILASKEDEQFHGKVQWRSMLFSRPIFAVAMAQLASDWLLYFVLTVFPAYFSDIYHMSQTNTGLVCGLPFLLVIPVCMLFGRVIDYLRLKDYLSTVGSRRLAEGIAKLFPATCFLVLTLLPTNATTSAMVTYIISVITFSAVTSGWLANVSDLAPQLSGIVMTISQTLALWTSFVVPVLVDYVTVDKTQEQWNTVFYITSAMQVISFVGFCMLSSGQLQSWAVSEEYRPICQPTCDD